MKLSLYPEQLYPNIPYIESPLYNIVTDERLDYTSKSPDWAEIDRRCKIVQDMIDGNRSE